ncbi:MAG: zinc ABC transporter substrate-binding protein [Planctomycetaceae bacterium]
MDRILSRLSRTGRGLCWMLCVAIAGCGGPEADTVTDPESRNQANSGGGADAGIQIVATTGMVADIVRVVVGDHGQVTVLVGEGVDPHLFTAGRNDVAHLLAADMVFYSGLMLEGKMLGDLDQVSRKGKPVVAVTAILEKSYLRTPPEFSNHPDPHVWMDVSAWSRCVSAVTDALAGHDPDHKADFQRNAVDYRKRLAEIDGYIRESVATIPENRRVLITAHDAFGYFAEAYGLEVRSIQGISTDSEAAIADITELIAFIVKNRVPSIFVESSVSEKNIRSVIEGCAAEGFQLEIGGELFSDAMGAPGTYEGTYIGMMDHNATILVRALGGEAPENGWQGKLTAQ